MRPSQYHYIKRALSRGLYNRKARKKRIKMQKKITRKQNRHKDYEQLLKSDRSLKDFGYKNSLLLFGIVTFGGIMVFQIIRWFVEMQDICNQIGLLKGLIILAFEIVAFGFPTYLCYYYYKKNAFLSKEDSNKAFSIKNNLVKHDGILYKIPVHTPRNTIEKRNKWLYFFFPIPSVILLILFGICLSFGTVDGNPVTFKDWLVLMIISITFIIVPLDIIIFIVKKVCISLKLQGMEPEPEPEPEPEEIITSKTACSHKNINDIQNQKNDKITNAEINHNKKKTLEESWALERKLRIYNAELREQDEQENYEQYKNITK